MSTVPGFDYGSVRYAETHRTEAIEAVLEAARERLEAHGYTIAAGLTVRQTADGVEHFALEVRRAGAIREVDVAVDLAGEVATSIVQTRRVLGRRVRDAVRRKLVGTDGRIDADALTDDLEAELP